MERKATFNYLEMMGCFMKKKKGIVLWREEGGGKLPYLV